MARILRLVIPDGIITIGDFAFANNQMASAKLSNTVQNIGNGAFQKNILQKMTLPDSVANLGEAVFMENALNNLIISNNIVHIQAQAFLRNYLSSVIIPDSVVSIGSQAFQYNYLETLIIPNNVTTIDSYAFANNVLANVTLGINLTTIGDNAFRDNWLTTVSIPNSVTSIGANAFAYNFSLTDVSLGSNLTSIGSEAFAYSGNLTKITIPPSVTTIGDKAFAGNYITEVVIGSNVVIDGDFAMGNYANFKSYYESQGLVGGTYRYIDGVWTNSVYVFDNGTILGYYGTDTDVVIPNYIDSIVVSAIGDSAFEGKNLTSVTIPSDVVSIGANAFKDNQLISISFPYWLNTIGNYAFQNNQLTSLNLPYNMTSIGDGVFQDNLLTSFQGYEITTIGDNAFKNNNITTLTMPKITTVGSSAFANNNITTLNIAKITNLGDNAFANNPITKIAIQENLTFSNSTIGSLGESFKSFYDANGKQARGYEYIEDAWQFTIFGLATDPFWSGDFWHTENWDRYFKLTHRKDDMVTEYKFMNSMSGLTWQGEQSPEGWNTYAMFNLAGGYKCHYNENSKILNIDMVYNYSGGTSSYNWLGTKRFTFDTETGVLTEGTFLGFQARVLSGATSYSSDWSFSLGHIGYYMHVYNNEGNMLDNEYRFFNINGDLLWTGKISTLPRVFQTLKYGVNGDSVPAWIGLNDIYYLIDGNLVTVTPSVEKILAVGLLQPENAPANGETMILTPTHLVYFDYRTQTIVAQEPLLTPITEISQYFQPLKIMVNEFGHTYVTGWNMSAATATRPACNIPPMGEYNIPARTGNNYPDGGETRFEPMSAGFSN